MQRDLLFLSEAIQAAQKIVRLSEGATADSLQADERTLDAVLWNFTVLGEACSQFTQKEQFPSISWHRPIAMRNRVRSCTDTGRRICRFCSTQSKKTCPA